MNGTVVVAAVREATATELDRLGSEKALIAATGADLAVTVVFRAAANAEARARETFSIWADDESHDVAREAFADEAAMETDHYERVIAELEAEPGEGMEDRGAASADLDPLHDYLRSLEGTAERVGAGMIGRSLITTQSLLQFVNFFVNEGATQEADLFRELRRDTDETVDRGAEILDSVCESEGDYERARETAIDAVKIAYGDYVDRLEDMGFDPKPVC